MHGTNTNNQSHATNQLFLLHVNNNTIPFNFTSIMFILHRCLQKGMIGRISALTKYRESQPSTRKINNRITIFIAILKWHSIHKKHLFKKE